MRLETSLTLYKTPLDSSYKNVYDDYNSTSQYKTFLDNNFTKITISIPNVKSRIDRNGSFTIIISGYTSMELHDYNYIAFSNNSEIKFAFITSINSKNDGLTSSECELVCKLDTWSNHYLELREFDGSQKMIRCTFDQYLSNYRYYPTRLKTLSPKGDKVRWNFMPRLISDYPVLWCRITLSPDTEVKLFGYSADDFETHSNYKYSQIENSPPTLYFPVAVMNISDYMHSNELEKNVIIRLKHGGLWAHGSPTVYDESIYYSQYRVGGNGLCTEFLSSSKIYNAIYTWYAPFRYTVTRTTESNNYVYTIKTQNPEMARCAVFLDSTNVVAAGVVKNWVGEAPGSGYTGGMQGDIEATFERPLCISSISDRYSRIDLASCEQSMFDYPFTYNSIKFNNSEVPILNESDCTTHAKIKIGMAPEVSLFIYKTGLNDIPFPSFGTILNHNGETPIVVSQFNDYLNSHEATHSLNIAKALTKSFLALQGGLLSKSPVAATMKIGHSGDDLFSIYAMEESLKKAPYELNNNATNCASDKWEQDGVYIIYNAPLTNMEYYEKIAKDLHYNGVPVDGVFNIFNKYRDIFDVCVCSNCDIKGNINNDDRDELNSAFNRGVTKWHISNVGASIYLKTFDKSVSNLYISQIGG